MEILSEIGHSGLWFVALITPLVFVHEMGHFLVARWCGVKVEVFSIGFGNEIFGFTDRRGTRWKIGWLPLGGYVRLFGQTTDELEDRARSFPDDLSPEERALSFAAKSVGRRAAIVAAGPAANYLFALLILAALFSFHGQAHRAPVIDGIAEKSAAEAAGFQPGDRILAIDGVPIRSFEEIGLAVQMALDRPLRIELDRAGTHLEIVAVPRLVVEKDLLGRDQKIAQLGIVSRTPGEVVRLGPAEALIAAGDRVWAVSAAILTGIGQMITGHRSSEELGGTLRIAAISGEMARSGWLDLIGLAALLSINLGLINLFPVPLLDGGHLVFYGIEALRGRPVSPRTQEWGLRIGLAMVLALMLFATWNDLVYLNVLDYLQNLFT